MDVAKDRREGLLCFVMKIHRGSAAIRRAFRSNLNALGLFRVFAFRIQRYLPSKESAEELDARFGQETLGVKLPSF